MNVVYMMLCTFLAEIRLPWLINSLVAVFFQENTTLDHLVKVTLSATSSVDLPLGSCFRSLGEASKFFETGSLGYSATSNGERLDGIQLRAQQWKVEPLAVEEVYSSYFADNSIFPEGTSSFDCALIMRNIQHEWHAANDLYVEPASQDRHSAKS